MCQFSARQSFKVFRQITWFLGNNRALYKFRHQLVHNMNNIIKLWNSQSLKANIELTTRATLKSRLIFHIFCCFCKKNFHISHVRISQKFIAKLSTYYFHMMTKILANFQICVGLSLTIQERFNWHLSTCVFLANKVWNMFKVNNKDSRTTALWLFCCLYY